MLENNRQVAKPKQKFSAVANIINDVIFNKKKNDVDNSQGVTPQEDELFYKVWKENPVEEQLQKGLDEWQNHTKVQVTVTGAVENDKAHLINTLLKATAPTQYGEAMQNQPSDMDCGEEDWAKNVRVLPKRQKKVKMYRASTQYAFESTDDECFDSFGDLNSGAAPENQSAETKKVGSSERRKPKRSSYRRATGYLFNHKGEEFQFDDTLQKVWKTFEPDGDFRSKIDWEREDNARLLLCDRDSMDIYSYLLPQDGGEHAPKAQLRYGKIPEVIVSFPEEAEFRLALWELHEVEIGTKKTATAAHLQLLQRRYRTILHLAPDTRVPLNGIPSLQDLPIPPAVKKLCGKSFRFMGAGKSFDEDRLFVREKLKEIVSHYAYYPCRLLVRVPSDVLKGNKEIINLSGTYNNDPSTVSAIRDANLLMVAVQSGAGITQDISSLLKSADFARLAATKPLLHDAVFLDMAQCKEDEDDMDGVNQDNARRTAERIKTQWVSLVSESLDDNNTNQESKRKVLERSMKETRVLQPKPMMFDKLTNNGLDWTKKQYVSSTEDDTDNDSMEYDAMSDVSSSFERLSLTSIPSLLYTIPNRSVARCCLPLKAVSDKIREPRRPPPKLPLKPLTAEQAAQKLERTRLSLTRLAGRISTELKMTLHALQPALAKKAHQCLGLITHKDDAQPLNALIDYAVQLCTNKMSTITPVVGEFAAQAARAVLQLKSIAESGKLSSSKRQRFATELARAELMVRTSLDRANALIMVDVDKVSRVIAISAKNNITLKNVDGNDSVMAETIMSTVMSLNEKYRSLMDSASSMISSSLEVITQYSTLVVRALQSVETKTSKRKWCTVAASDRVYAHPSTEMMAPASGAYMQLSSRQRMKPASGLKRMRRALKRARLRCIPVKPDCHAQFRVIAHQVYGNASLYAIVRILLCGEILANASQYASYLQEGDIQAYVNGIAHEEACGEDLTMCAAANFYSSDIMIWSPDKPRPTIIQCRKSAQSPSALVIVRLGDSYESVVPVEPKPRVTSMRQMVADGLAEGKPNDRPQKKRRLSAENLSLAETSALGPQTLSQICINVILGNLNVYKEDMWRSIPLHLMTWMFDTAQSCRVLTDDMMDKLLHPCTPRVTIEGPLPTLTNAGLFTLAQKCNSLSRLQIHNMQHITDKGIIQLVSRNPHLMYVSLKGCTAVTGMAVQVIARKCSGVRAMDLSGCITMTDIAIQEICLACTNLTCLQLNGCNQLTDAAFNYLHSQILELSLAQCHRVTAKTVMYIAQNCSNIQKLSLSHLMLTDVAMAMLAKLATKLCCLDLSSARGITDAGMQAIVYYARNLVELDISSMRTITHGSFRNPIQQNSPQPAGPKPLHRLSVFKAARIPGLTDPAMITIGQLAGAALTRLTLSASAITDQGMLKVCETCPNIVELDLSLSAAVSDLSVQGLAKHCRRIKSVSFYGLPRVSDIGIQDLAASLKGNLEKINLCCCDSISSNSITALTTHCKSLTFLGLEECRIDEKGVSDIAKLNKLTFLSFAHVAGVTDASLAQLAKGCPLLDELVLAHCSNISWPVLSASLKKWKLLRKFNLRGYLGLDENAIIEHEEITHLNISWCKNATDTTVCRAINLCPKLECLNLSWLPNVTGNSIVAIATKSSVISLNIRGCTRIGQDALRFLSTTPILVQR